HERVKPRIIMRGGSHSAWTIEEAEFDNMPRVDCGEVYTNGVDEVQKSEFPQRDGSNWVGGETFVLILEDEETEPQEASWTSTSSGTMAANMQSALRGLPT